MGTPTVYSTRAAKQLDAATVDIARAQAARERAEAEAAIQSTRLAAQALADQAQAEAEQARSERRTRALEQRRAVRAAARARLHGALAQRRVLLATVAVICLFVTVALPAQIGFLSQRWPLPMALAGGIALESLTWVFALQGRAREARGLSAGVHYGGIWGAAGIAAWINLSHGARMWGSGFAIVAACGSLAAPIVWHMYLLSQKNTPTTDPQQVRRARSRRRHHRKVARLAARMATALPQDLDPDEAWTLAWRAVHGAEPGITAALLADHHKAAAKVAAAMKATTPTPLDPALKVLAHPLTPGSDARVVIEQAFAAARPVSELLGVYTPDSTPRTPLSPLTGHGARTGAYNQLNGRTDTRTSTLHAPRTPPVRAAESEAAMEAKRQQARAAIRRTLALNGTPSPTEIGRAHGLSAEWGAKQIRAVRNEQSATPHPVPASVH